METITIVVSNEDIKNARGHEQDAHSCVIAQAITRQTQAGADVSVVGSDEITIGGIVYEAADQKNAEKIDEIIGAFDDQEGVYIRRGKIVLTRKVELEDEE